MIAYQAVMTASKLAAKVDAVVGASDVASVASVFTLGRIASSILDVEDFGVVVADADVDADAVDSDKDGARGDVKRDGA